MEAVNSSPIMHSAVNYGGGALGGAAGNGIAVSGAGGFEEFGGIDPSQDPELAMAIRMSTEEARQREESKVSLLMVCSCFALAIYPMFFLPFKIL